MSGQVVVRLRPSPDQVIVFDNPQQADPAHAHQFMCDEHTRTPPHAGV
jgi:hypothetical protein